MGKGRVIILREAEFTPKVQAYWLLSGIIICIVTIFGIPLLPIWLLIGWFVTDRYRKSFKAILTERSLKVSYGLLTKVEKTIPLEKITDMGMVQGPIMRAMDLHKLTVETAGTSGPGALVGLTGIINAPDFRDAVLSQRDKLAGAKDEDEEDDAAAPTRSAVGAGDQAVLIEIRDTLKRIESHLSKRSNPA